MFALHIKFDLSVVVSAVFLADAMFACQQNVRLNFPESWTL